MSTYPIVQLGYFVKPFCGLSKMKCQGSVIGTQSKIKSLGNILLNSDILCSIRFITSSVNLPDTK